MDRIERSKETYKKLFGEGTPAAYATDPEFQDILSHFIFGEVFYQGDLDDKTRELLTIVVLATNQTLPQLGGHIGAALNVGLTPIQIREAMYHTAPYIGFPRALNAINTMNSVFEARGIQVPLEPQAQVTEETRNQTGIDTRVAVSGDRVYATLKNAPDNQRYIQENINHFVFGDIWSREGLDMKTRAMLTVCILAAQGGCDPQVKNYVGGFSRLGGNKATIIAAIGHCMPYMGSARALNALNCINEALPE